MVESSDCQSLCNGLLLPGLIETLGGRRDRYGWEPKPAVTQVAGVDNNSIVGILPHPGYFLWGSVPSADIAGFLSVENMLQEIVKKSKTQ